MYYQNYEDYMRSVLGYPIERQNTYESYENYYRPATVQTMAPSVYQNIESEQEILDLYPDIYRIVNPMVCKICDANTQPISRELIDKMTEEIYMNLEGVPEIETILNVRVTAGKDETSNSKNLENRNSIKTSKSREINRSGVEADSSKRETRQLRQRNNLLRDLIRILILNRLLGRPRPRPPFPGNRPPRPPFPGGPNRNYLEF